MTLRVVTAGLLVGVLGVATLALVLAVEHFTLKQVQAFIAQHPEAFPVAPNTAAFALLVATVWLGFIFAFLFQQAHPAPTTLATALRFGGLCWLGLVAPVAALPLLWTSLPRAGVAAALGGWLLQLLVGSLLLPRLLQPAPAGTPEQAPPA